MASNEIQPQKVRPLAARLIFAAVKVLKENGGEMRGKQVLEEVEKRVQLGEWDKQRFEKTGYIRWKSVLHFYSIDLTKAGFLIKKKVHNRGYMNGHAGTLLNLRANQLNTQKIIL